MGRLFQSMAGVPLGKEFTCYIILRSVGVELKLNKRFLITTALEDTWTKDKPVLFLGEWCKRYSRSDKWSQLDFNILPYHWDDRNKMFEDYSYLQTFYEELLLDLSVKLNVIHGVSYSLRYWRIIVGPWLGYFVQVLFDRWTSVQQAINEYEISGTIVLTGDFNEFVPCDMKAFVDFIIDDKWNHFIYATILKKYTSVSCITRYSKKINSISTNNVKIKTLKQRFRALYMKGMGLFVKRNDAFFLATYLPVFDEILLAIRMRQAPQKWLSVSVDVSGVKKEQRQWELMSESSSNFEVFAREMVSKQIPTAYLEGYKKLIEQTKNLQWPKFPKLILTSNSCNSDDVFKAWAAGKVEKGTPLVIGQHGGHYGTGKYSFNEEHEIAICDYYLSWGWGEDNKKIIPIGQITGKKPLNTNNSGKTKALLVTTTVPRYSYWMYSIMVSRQFLDYLNYQCRFIESLPNEIRDSLVVRLYSNDYGWDQEKILHDRLPNQKIDIGKININNLIRQSRLYISTYNATTFLESFTMGVPTVIYWEPKIFELRDSAIPFFNELKEVGVFHETPESAANHVAEIWGDVESWWESREVSQAVKRFCNQYAHLPNDYLKQLEFALTNVITEYSSDDLDNIELH